MKNDEMIHISRWGNSIDVLLMTKGWAYLGALFYINTKDYEAFRPTEED